MRDLVFRKNTGILLAGLLFVIILGVGQAEFRNFAPDFETVLNSGKPGQYLGLTLEPAVIRAFLGTRLMVADLVWVDVLFKSDVTREKKDFTSFYYAAKVITELDEDNVYAYYFAGLYLSVVKDDIKAATAILRDGASYLERTQSTDSQGWKVYFALAYNLILEEGEVEEGARWAQKVLNYPNAPLYARALAEKTKTEDGRLELGSRILDDLFRKAGDPEVKKRISKKMLDLASRQELLDLNHRFQVFLSTTEAYALPKPRAFQMFMRSLGQSKRDLLGHALGIDRLGNIVTLDK